MERLTPERYLEHFDVLRHLVVGEVAPFPEKSRNSAKIGFVSNSSFFTCLAITTFWTTIMVRTEGVP